MEIPARLIDSVEQIEIWIDHGETDADSTLSIAVTGSVESSHWTDPQLYYLDTPATAPTGVHPYDVYEFEFFATPPQVGELYSMDPTPIKTIFNWTAYSKNMKVIRIISKAGTKEIGVDLGGPGTPIEGDVPVQIEGDVPVQTDEEYLT